MIVNINVTVLVRLTPAGEAVLNRRDDDLRQWPDTNIAGEAPFVDNEIEVADGEQAWSQAPLAWATFRCRARGVSNWRTNRERRH